jgi:hypothetical protein
MRCGHVAWIEETKNAYKILTEDHEIKIPVGIPRFRRKDNIKTAPEKMKRDDVNEFG